MKYFSISVSMYRADTSNVMSEFSRWWLDCKRSFILVLVLTFILPFSGADDAHLLQSSSTDTKSQISYINISYMDKDTKKEVIRKYDGVYGKNSLINAVSGVVMHTISSPNKSGTGQGNNNYGCTNYVNLKFPSEPWIALVERGECSFTDKIRIATKDHNASAIVIYNTADNNLPLMDHDKTLQSISVLVTQANGKDIVNLLDKGYIVRMQIIPGPDTLSSAMQNSISKTSVLFVSISFIVLMIISLAWLVFYYIQRFRYSHAKERLARRLVCAAKKAIAKIPQRTVKAGDKELDSEFDQCAVCIEPYKAHDVIRILPCRHTFHKSCVDPWLLDQRSCPMCKLDILRAFGMQIGGSQESVHADAEAGPVATILQEPEVSSSVEDTQTEEVKVLLVPHTCLHFRSGCDKVSVDDDEAMSSLLGAVGGSVPKSSSTCSLSSKSSRYSRTGKSDKDDSFNSEIKSLIGKRKGKSERWQSRGECGDDDEDDIDENAVRDFEHLANVIETVKTEQELMSSCEDILETGSIDTSSTLSFPPPPPPLTSEQLNDQDCATCVEESELGKEDEQADSHRGSLVITAGDESICHDAVVKAEFHNEDYIDIEMGSRT